MKFCLVCACQKRSTDR